MLDVIHVLYEEDITPRHETDIEVKDAVRSALYPQLYGKPYPFAMSKQKSAGTGTTFGVTQEEWEKMPQVDDIDDSEAFKPAPKPYIPPTSSGDLMGIVGAPLN